MATRLASKVGGLALENPFAACIQPCERDFLHSCQTLQRAPLFCERIGWRRAVQVSVPVFLLFL